jgi:ABC-type nitrate/sulfonate/bicarbonate transport system substrate-binding protein
MKSGKLKLPIRLNGIAFLVIGLLLWPVTARSADQIKLSVLSTGADHWANWVAKDQGYFKQQNLEIREFHTNSVAKAVQAVSSGSSDLFFPANTQGTITAVVKGAPIKIIAGNYTKAIYDLITGAKYKKIEDLKGTTFGVINLTSGSTVLLMKIMAAHGLKYPGDYDFLTVGGTPARFAAVKKGAVSGAMVTIPVSFEAREAGLNVLANIGTYLPDYQFTTIAGNANWLPKNKDTTVRFLMAMIKAVRFINDPKNKAAAVDSMVKHHKISRKYSELAYKMVVEDLKVMRNDAAPSTKGIETVINMEVERKALDKSYPPSMFIEDSYRQEAVKRLGG